MENDKVTDNQVLDLSRVVAAKVLGRWPILRSYSDEVYSEALVAATLASQHYRRPGLVFSWGIKFASSRLLRAMRVQGYIPDDRADRRVYRAADLPLGRDGTDVVDDYNESMEPHPQVGWSAACLLAGLPTRERDVVTRCWIDDEPRESVATSIGVSRQMVHNILSKCRAALKRALAREDHAA